jgi:hypothetical protein
MVRKEYFSEREMSTEEKSSKLVEITRELLEGINILKASVRFYPQTFVVFRGKRQICQVNPYAMRIDAYDEDGSKEAMKLALAYEEVFGKDSFTLKERFSRSILK